MLTIISKRTDLLDGSVAIHDQITESERRFSPNKSLTEFVPSCETCATTRPPDLIIYNT